MKTTILLAFCFATVYSQTFPYLSFMGNTLPNHAYVDINLLGSSDDEGIQCYTDLYTCCSSTQGSHRGDWYFPNKSRVLFIKDIYRQRQRGRVVLERRNNVTSPSGIYRCDISTTSSVHNSDNTSSTDSVFVGIYGKGGDVAISGGITINVNSTLRLSDPLFTLTCISIGGPATNVIWTKDSVIVTEGTKSVLDDPVTARYTHTLTGNTRGEYTCTVTNAKPSNDSATIILQVNQPPSNVTAVQETPTSIRISWSLSSSATGYMISYHSEGSNEMFVNINDGSTTYYLLTGLQSGTSYNVSIVATYDQSLPSDIVVLMVRLMEPPDKPSVYVTSIEATSITLFWSVSSDSVVTSSEVMWQMISNGGNVNSGKRMTSGRLTSDNYTIESLKSSTMYNITITLSNSVGNTNSQSVLISTLTILTVAENCSFNSSSMAMVGSMVIGIVLIITTSLTIIVIVALVLKHRSTTRKLNAVEESISVRPFQLSPLTKDFKHESSDAICTPPNEAYEIMNQIPVSLISDSTGHSIQDDTDAICTPKNEAYDALKQKELNYEVIFSRPLPDPPMQ